NLDQYIFQLQTKGYKVILAHPERYLFLRDNRDRVESLKSRGVEFQLNLLSLIGYYGKPIQEHAERLLKAGFIDYLATDLHHERHATNLEVLLTDRKLAKLLNPYIGQFRNRELMGVAEKDSIA
ncbi:MAG: CpsB/CapC family capsule biosynthesis tyrosine phosphatase, partial [Bacteroidota bacterium]